MSKVIKTVFLLLLTINIQSQEFESKRYKKTVESIGYRWDFERRYQKEQPAKEHLFVSPGNYLEMNLYQNELWFKDWSKMNFRILNTDTKKEQSKGKSGQGPNGENGQIMFFDKTDEGIFLYDFDKLAFKEFSNESFEMKSLFRNKEITFYRGSYLGSNKYLMRYDDSLADHGFAFVVYDVTTKKFEKIFKVADLMDIDEYRDMEMSFEGRFVKSSNRQHIFYFCHYGGRVFKFDKNGNFQYTIETIDKTPIPGVKKYKFGSGYAPRPKLGVDFFLDATVNNTHLILLNILEKGEGHVVDFYKVADGSYDYSLHISDYEEQAAALIAADNKGLYVMYEENDIIRYELR